MQKQQSCGNHNSRKKQPTYLLSVVIMAMNAVNVISAEIYFLD